MDEDTRQEIAEIKKLRSELLEYLPPRRWSSRSILVPVVALFALLATLSFFFYPFGMAQTNFQRMLILSDLSRHEKLWKSQNINSYEYTIVYVGSEKFSLRVRVENGTVSFPSGNEYLKFFEGKDNVPELFGFISDATQGRRSESKVSMSRPVDFINAKYNPDFGYPTYIFVKNETLLDYGFGYVVYYCEIFDFKILEQGRPAK